MTVTGPGDRVPTFTLPQFRGAGLVRWRPGQVTVLCFCALWCDTWRTQSARLREVQRALAGLPIRFETVSVDGRWAEKYDSGAPRGSVLLDTGGRLSAALGVRAVPSTFVLDTSGVVRFAAQGIVRSDEMQALLRALVTRRETSLPQSGMVYLTFDDFPLPGDELLLDILRAAEVPATFFCLGEHLTRPLGEGMARRAVREGHMLQIHSWDHDQAAPQIARCVRALLRIAPGQAPPPALYRPPGTSLLLRLNGLALTPKRRVVNPYDFARPGEVELLRRVSQTVGPGAVVQLHAGVEETRSAVPALVRALRQRGFTFGTLH
ncbi:MAG: polysaccharide deacetylase family protein [Cytophagales bacterium]|nr:polysaccharide deacetylase family protein [Armatimonadota bacterium]